MKINEIKKKIRSDIRQLVLVIKKIDELDKTKNYKLIDVGAGEKYLEHLLPKNIKYKSLDYAGDHDYIFDLDKGRLPIKNNSFDIVVCTETLEHTLYPDRIMKELIRIGKKDALFVLSMPNEYNFWIRLQYLFNIKNVCQESFKTTTNHLHIHSPRAKDILKFFSKYLDIDEVYYGWHSWSSVKGGIKGIIGKVADGLIDMLAKICPSLFARTVAVSGRAKAEKN